MILRPKVAPRRRYRVRGYGVRPKGDRAAGNSNRTHRNALVYLAADEDRLGELDAATRDFLGWSHVLDDEADLDLTQNQKNQATKQQAQS